MDRKKDENLRWEQADEGAELLREGLVDEAIVELGRVAEEHPKNEYAHFFLGCAHFDRQDYTKAMRCYLTALEVAPRYVGAMTHLGHTLRALGRYQEAIRMAKEVLHINDSDPDALYLAGASYFARGDEKAAIDHLERFLKTKPEAEAAIEVEGLLQTLRGQVIPHEQLDGDSGGN